MDMKVISLVAAAVALAASAALAQGSRAPVKIGVMTDMSSLYSDINGPGSVEAARMAAEDAGLVLGAPAEIVFADNQTKPDAGPTIAREWLDADQVATIADVAASSVALAVQEIARDKKKIVL